ncbi:hypothetical protein MTR_3g062870 [Medicago truncatula]|uniref:Uncharacterized protein n=1 Tax=Medicago truncatula TaxID=3880 RepID=G7IV76_MEDTR|nr:hypothetical protein MTR_3g062870 [Medicago truncatula]
MVNGSTVNTVSKSKYQQLHDKKQAQKALSSKTRVKVDMTRRNLQILTNLEYQRIEKIIPPNTTVRKNAVSANVT